VQTTFSPAQLKDPQIAEANGILRTCVHCGFCTATCPTYVLLGDELDSPRGRIYLIKNMLESGAAATAETAKHVDRCLSCLACMTTCPSGVNYMHLIDMARVHVEKTYDRPFADTFMRRLLAYVMPRPDLFRLAIVVSRPMRMLAPLFKSLGFARLSAMLDLVPKSLPRPQPLGRSGTFPAEGHRKGRIGLLLGCVQSVLDPGINAATIRLLTRLGYEVVVSAGEACCGSLEHHAGLEDAALARARRSIDQWADERVDAVVITASGCGTVIKDYGHMLRLDPAYAEKAKAISAKAKDVTEFLGELNLPEGNIKLRLAYHSACSMQHGQNIKTLPQSLLRRAGFEVHDVPEGHLCCGSAGTYNILQPEISTRLRERKIQNIKTTRPEAVATGNLGCITQLQSGLGVPILHTVELLDWAYGGPKPSALGEPP
jgi:glycolate oxidase iron-sulfur subunit